MAQSPRLVVLDSNVQHRFETPRKRINEGEDVSSFLTSKAYGDILAFLLQLNAAMFPRRSRDPEDKSVQTWELDTSAVSQTEQTKLLTFVIRELSGLVSQAPPDPGPRRFGNVSFRKWYSLAESDLDRLLKPCYDIIGELATDAARKEVATYLLGSFGSAQRLDFGTGHELSFLAFLGGLWKLGFFGASTDNQQERAIVLHVIEPYLDLIRHLVKTYNLEPAGTHGVWGLDDHFFIPYILGSAQFGPPIPDGSPIPQEGSLPGAPDPGEVAQASAVDRHRSSNMYFAAIGFIYDVKKGPFWEHSPMLFDISGVRAGWGKINKGMIKMYIAEVLSKFPVVQHFPFGYLFQWERDPDAVVPAATVHTSSQPSRGIIPPGSSSVGAGTAAPWAPRPTGAAATGAPSSRPHAVGTRMPAAIPGRAPVTPPMPMSNTRAPWATARALEQDPGSSAAPDAGPTKAPWAK